MQDTQNTTGVETTIVIVDNRTMKIVKKLGTYKTQAAAYRAIEIHKEQKTFPAANGITFSYSTINAS